MKARIYILSIISCLAALFVSCSDSWPYSEERYDEVWINAYPSYISLNEDELSGEFDVSSTVSWYVYDYPSWIHPYNTSGYGYGDVEFTVDANNSNYTRYGQIKIKAYEGDGFNKETEVEIAQPPTKKAPFVINSIEIANIDYNSNIINNFGSIIYSYQTKYLVPRLYISVNTPGTYMIYTKLYKPDGRLSTGTSSPYGYTNSREVTIYSYYSYINMIGWGNNTAGHWSAGRYRWEFWYDGEKIGEKSFTIY